MAIYESGSPDVLTVLLSSQGFDDMVARAEYLKRIQGYQETVVGRVRQLRNEAKRTVIRLAEARRRIEAARDAIAAKEQQLASARASVESRQADLVAARGRREAALAQIKELRAEARGIGRRHPEQDPGAAAGRHGLGAAAGRATSRAELGRLHLARGRRGRLTLRLALRRIGDAPRDRHRGRDGDSDPRRRGRDRGLHRARVGQRRLRQLHLHRPWWGPADVLRAPGVLRRLGRASRSPRDR